MATYVDAKVHELDELAVHEGELLRGGERRCGGYEVVCLPEVEDEHKRASALHDDARYGEMLGVRILLVRTRVAL